MRGSGKYAQLKKDMYQQSFHSVVHPATVTDDCGLSAGVAMVSQWAYAVAAYDLPPHVVMPPAHRVAVTMWYGFALLVSRLLMCTWSLVLVTGRMVVAGWWRQ